MAACVAVAVIITIVVMQVKKKRCHKDCKGLFLARFIRKHIFFVFYVMNNIKFECQLIISLVELMTYMFVLLCIHNAVMCVMWFSCFLC